MFKKKMLSIVLLSVTTSYVFAKLPTSNMPTQLTQQAEQNISSSSQNYSTITDSAQKKYQEEQANRWGITEQEWQKFEEIKKGPRGYWSPNLDPLTTLGIEAETDAERQYYAEIQVRMEYERTEKELAYQRAYSAAFKRLYPNRLPVEKLGKATKGVMSVTTNQRLSVFIKQNCAACEKHVKDLDKTNASFDIYMIDSNNDDNAIRKWATKLGINSKKVLSKTITLNHGSKLWKTVGNDSMPLPATFQEVNGQLVRSK